VSAAFANCLVCGSNDVKVKDDDCHYYCFRCRTHYVVTVTVEKEADLIG